MNAYKFIWSSIFKMEIAFKKMGNFSQGFKIQTAKELNHVSEKVITVVKLIHFAFPVAISYNLPVCIYIGNKK